MKITRIGVVGIGHQGKRHLEKYQKIEHCTIVGISDSDETCIDDEGASFGYRGYTDHRDLIGKVDAVSITVPTDAHYATAKDFLANGIHILLEKPMAKTLDEADELIQLSREQNAFLQVGFIERFNPAITALTKYLERPLFIEAHRLHPFLIRGTDVDVILDLMIRENHESDKIRYPSKIATPWRQRSELLCIRFAIDSGQWRQVKRPVHL